MGSTTSSASRIADDLEASRLVRVLPEWSVEHSSTWIVTPSRCLLPRKTLLFIQHLEARSI